MKRTPPLRTRLAAIPPRRLLIFLDYDGTLTPIVRRPRDARLQPAVKRTLSRLVRSVPVTIVSGRALSDLKTRVGVPSLRYVAQHGFVYQEPGGARQWLGPRVPRAHVQSWRGALQAAADGIPGALVEDKGTSVALHHRQVRSADRPRLRRRALRALAPWLAKGKARLTRGKCVLEVGPAGSCNKGAAVAALLRRPWARNRVPIYIGDDRTDFDAFRVVRNRGLAIRVGGRRGIAGENSWTPDAGAVAVLLRRLATTLP
jgi:trehalose 6-phosphate phosphatase